MLIDARKAADILAREAGRAAADNAPLAWVERIRGFSRICKEADCQTHVAFLGTAILAKCVAPKVDPGAIKAKLGGNAYSARSLCHGVLVPASRELGFSLGVSGREPLNNQPYFRIERLGDGTPVHGRAAAAFALVEEMVRELSAVRSSDMLCSILRAYILVRREFNAVYKPLLSKGQMSVPAFACFLEDFAAGVDAEGGKVAQAVVKGVLSAGLSWAEVESGRINDPSRKTPGDVIARAPNGKVAIAVEVRDKPVSESDILIFADECIAAGIGVCGVFAIAPNQGPLNMAKIADIEQQSGVLIRLFLSWRDLVEEVFAWGSIEGGTVTIKAIEAIHAAAIAVEVSERTVSFLVELAAMESVADL